MLKHYELTLVIDSQLPEEAVEETIKRYETFVAGQGASVVNVVRRGVRKLAYEIKKHQQAVYAFVEFQGEPGIVPELDRACKLDESVLRHMVVVSESGVVPPPSDAEEEDGHAEGEDDEEDAKDADGEDEVEEMNEENVEEEDEKI